MTPEWFYSDDPDEPHGPLTWEQLKRDAASGRIDLHALIWRENGSGRKRGWTVRQLMAACLSDRRLRDEESYIVLGDDDEADGGWDDTIDFDEATEDGGDFDLDPEEDELARKAASAPTIVPRKALVGHEAGVTSLAFRPGTKPLRLASGSFDGTVRLWNIRTERMLACLKGHRDTIEVVAFSPTQPLLASASRDGTVRLWDLAGDERRSATWEHGAPVTALAFSADGKVIVTGGYDGTIRWWDVRTGTQAHCVEARNPVESLCLTPDGATIISTHAPKLVRRWDFASAEEIRPGGHPSWVVEGCNIVACSPDGAKFAVAGNMKTLGDISIEETAFEVGRLGYVSIWDVPALTERSFRAHAGEGFSVAFSPDGGFLASTGADGATRLWDASDLSLYGTLGGHRSAVYTVRFSPGGRFIVTGGEDATIQVYDTSFAYLGRGESRLDSGRVESAVADFTRAVRAGRVGLSRGRVRVRSEPHIEMAGASFQEASRLGPSDSRQAGWLGRGFVELGEAFEEAENREGAGGCFRRVVACLEKATDLEPEHWLLLARAYFGVGRLSESHTAFNRYFEFPNDPCSFYGELDLVLACGISCIWAGDSDAGVEHLQVIVNCGDLVPELAPVALYGIGKAHLAKGEHGEAARCFAEACASLGYGFRRWRLSAL